MKIEKFQFFQSRRLPARMTAEETGWVLGFAEHDLPILVRVGLLKPLGHPAQNAIKYFATAEIERLQQDVKWLSRASDAVAHHWREQNARRKPNGALLPVLAGEMETPGDRRLESDPLGRR